MVLLSSDQRTQCRCTFELVRLPGLQARGLNPWRVRKQAVVPTWEKGNQGVTGGGLRDGDGGKREGLTGLKQGSIEFAL